MCVTTTLTASVRQCCYITVSLIVIRCTSSRPKRQKPRGHPAYGKKSVCLLHLSNIHTFAEFKRTYVDYPVQLLQRCVSLLNAPRRTGTGNAEPAVRLLLRARNPRELLDAKDADVRLLMTARTEVNSELASAKRSRPRFSGPVALICVHSACQLHPLIAQIWRMRLPEYIVNTANFGYREG